MFALLMALAMFFYSRMTYKQTASAGPQMAGMKFMTVYLMPILMLCWFNSYASGLTYYYLLSQALHHVDNVYHPLFGERGEVLPASCRATPRRPTAVPRPKRKANGRCAMKRRSANSSRCSASSNRKPTAAARRRIRPSRRAPRTSLPKKRR